MSTPDVPYFEKDDDSQIDLTPMLDVVFIMLIFFIVTASFIKESGIEVNRPNGASNPTTDANILVAISDTNEIWIDRRMIDPMPDSMVVIQADKKSHNNTLVQVMDSARAAGIYNIAIATNAD